MHRLRVLRRVSFHSTSSCRRSAAVSSASSETRCSGSAAMPPSSVRKCSAIRSIVAASNRSVLYSTLRPALRALGHVQRQVELRRVSAPETAQRARPGSSRLAGACSAGEHHLEQRRAAQSRSGAAPRPASRTAHPGARRPPSATSRPAQQLREGGSPDRSVRSTSVLTKKPIRFSVSACVAPGDRRAHRYVFLARVTG